MVLGFCQMTGALDGQWWRPSRGRHVLPRAMDNDANERVGTEADGPEDAWWAALAKRAIHPVEVQIIEALAASKTPLPATDLGGRVSTKLKDAQLVPHMRRLRRLEAIEVAGAQRGKRPVDIRYRLAPLRRRNGDQLA
jgi:hypothetical protein